MGPGISTTWSPSSVGVGAALDDASLGVETGSVVGSGSSPPPHAKSDVSTNADASARRARLA